MNKLLKVFALSALLITSMGNVTLDADEINPVLGTDEVVFNDPNLETYLRNQFFYDLEDQPITVDDMKRVDYIEPGFESYDYITGESEKIYITDLKGMEHAELSEAIIFMDKENPIIPNNLDAVFQSDTIKDVRFGYIYDYTQVNIPESEFDALKAA